MTRFFSNGERDIFIARYNAVGSPDKFVSFGGPGYDYVKNVTLKARSGIVLPVQFDRDLTAKFGLRGKALKEIT